ncbi:MAG: ABC transporter permease, partial [Bacilli bacterium]|nr:ABC transporter permease [Bacilli bacterium]
FRDAVLEVLKENYTDTGVLLMMKAAKSYLNWGDGTVNPRDDARFTSPNQYLVKLLEGKNPKDYLSKIEDYFKAKEEDEEKYNNLVLLSDRSTMPFVITLNNDVTQAKQFTYLFPFVFFFVGVLVILTTISQIILKERGQIGTLKAIGLSKREIIFHYISLTCTVVLIGILIGEIVGPLLIPYILGQKYSILYALPPIKIVFPVLPAILTALIFLGLTALVTYLICRKEVYMNPVESMRPAPPKFKKTFSKNRGKSRSTFFLSFKMAMRNIRVDPLKSIMVFAGVMGCTALLIAGFGIEDTVYYGIYHDLDMGYDASLTIGYNANVDKDKAYSDLLSVLPEGSIKNFQAYSALNYDVSDKEEGKTITTRLYLLDEVEPFHMKVDFDHDKCAVSEKVAADTGLVVGDTIRCSNGTNVYEMEVSAIYQAFFFKGVVVSTKNPNFKNVTSFSSAYLDINDGFDVEQCKATILEKIPNCNEASTKADWVRAVNDVMSGVLVMTMAIKIFAMLLAAIVLYNLALLNFKERTRDIATLKVLGFSVGEIAQYLLWKKMLLTLLGVLAGLAVGFPFMYAVLSLNIVELVDYIYVINISSYIFSFILTFVLSFILNLLFAFATRKTKMVESLKSVE